MITELKILLKNLTRLTSSPTIPSQPPSSLAFLAPYFLSLTMRSWSNRWKRMKKRKTTNKIYIKVMNEIVKYSPIKVDSHELSLLLLLSLFQILLYFRTIVSCSIYIVSLSFFSPDTQF